MRVSARLRVLVIGPLIACTAGIVVAPWANAAVSVSKAELSGGQLRVEGSGALANHAITISPGNVTGTSDGKGAYKIQVSGYSSPSCKVTVSDGSTTTTAALSGCTVTSAPNISISATTLNFGSSHTGVATASQTITLTDTGTAPLFFNGDRPTGPDAFDFGTTGDTCVGISIQPGTSCTYSIDFDPGTDGARTSTFTFFDTAPSSPQVITVNGFGLGTATGPTPMSLDTSGLACTAGVCDLGDGFAFTAGNFYLKELFPFGGTPPYTYSLVSTGAPTGLSVTSDGFVSGNLPTAVGTYPLTLTVRDTKGASLTQRYTLPVQAIPAPGDPGCQKGGNVRAALGGAAIAGKIPSGQAQEDESKLTACGGFGAVSVSVTNVGLPNGSVLWVYLDGGAIGTLTLSGGAGSIKPFITGQGLRFDSVSISSGPPSRSNQAPVVLSGGPFT